MDSQEHSDCMNEAIDCFFPLLLSRVPHFGSKAVGLDFAGISLFTKDYYQCFVLGYN